MAEIDLRNQDKRTADRYIRQGQIEDKAWEKHLKSLPDVSDKCSPVEVVMDEDIDDENDDAE